MACLYMNKSYIGDNSDRVPPFQVPAGACLTRYTFKPIVMARITEKGLSGRVGPVIYYQMNGKQYARAFPVYKKKRSRAATKPAAALFGQCSATASTAAYALQASLPFPFLYKPQNSFRGWLYKYYKLHHEQHNWVLGQNFLPPCQLNPDADLRDFLFAPIEIRGVVDGRLHIHVPAFDPVKQIMNPVRAASACISIMVQGLSFGKEQECFFPEEKLPVDFSEIHSPARDLFFEHASMKPESVLMVTVALSFQMQDESFIKNTDCLPAAVVGMGRAEGRET